MSFSFHILSLSAPTQIALPRSDKISLAVDVRKVEPIIASMADGALSFRSASKKPQK